MTIGGRKIVERERIIECVLVYMYFRRCRLVKGRVLVLWWFRWQVPQFLQQGLPVLLY